MIGPGGSPLRLVVREIRASFYRKLFLAFVADDGDAGADARAASSAPSWPARLRADVEADATRTAAVAQRVIEEAIALQQRSAGATVGGLNDDVMVWISRIINQDVNIFDGPDAAGHQRARPVRVGPAADADAGRGLPRRRHRAAADLRR